jgi:hypothetical protein
MAARRTAHGLAGLRLTTKGQLYQGLRSAKVAFLVN